MLRKVEIFRDGNELGYAIVEDPLPRWRRGTNESALCSNGIASPSMRAARLSVNYSGLR